MAEAKGALIRSTRRWIEEVHGAPMCASIEDNLDAATRDVFRLALAATWYAPSTLDAVWKVVAKTVFRGDFDAAVRGFRQIGSFIAKDNLGSIYSAVLGAIGTPLMMYKAMPRIWGRYFRGMEVGLVDSSRGIHSFDVRGLGGISYLSPASCGWGDFAWSRVGAEDFEIRESNFREDALGPNIMKFTTRWRGSDRA